MTKMDYLELLVDEIHSTTVATIGSDGHPQTRIIDMMYYDEEGIRLCGVGRAFDGDGPLIVGAGRRTPGAVFLLHIHSDSAVHADAVVAACLSGSRQKDIAQRLHRALSHHTVGRDTVDGVRPLPGVVGAEFCVRYQ